MDTISILYSLNGIILGMAFLPQIVRLVRDQTGAAALSLQSWLTFSTCSVITLLYATFNVHDTLFIVCAAIGVTGNLLVLTLALLRRMQQRAVRVTPAGAPRDML